MATCNYPIDFILFLFILENVTILRALNVVAYILNYTCSVVMPTIIH